MDRRDLADLTHCGWAKAKKRVVQPAHRWKVLPGRAGPRIERKYIYESKKPPPNSIIADVQWNSIRLELSRSRQFPNGSVARVFIVRLPLDGEGRIDRALLAGAARRATACRFWSADPDQWGFVVIEEERLRLFSGRHKRYLTFEADVPALGGNATIEEKDGEKMEFRIVEVRRR